MTVEAPVLIGAKAQEYDRLRSLGHSVECAYRLVDGADACTCPPQSIEAESPKSEERKRGRPRKYATGAAKQAAYRERHLVRLADLAGQIIAMEVPVRK
jgi:AT hook motif